ncbi:MAG: RND family transporter [Acutalibacteraceae bacterium]
MIKFCKSIVKLKIPIIIISLLLLIPSVFGIAYTRINYDMLDYLPKDIETMKGQDILLKDFGKGAFSFVIFEGMDDKDVVKAKEKIEKVDHVETALWYDSLVDISIPKEILPDKIYEAFNSGDATMVAVFFDTTTSADETMQAIEEIRSISSKQCFVSGMSALVTDLKNLCEQEEPIYVAIAVALSTIIMMLFMDSYIIPFLFLASIGIAIVLNLGSNVFFGEISFITKALSAVLQLAVTMDYSIFLWHSYQEQKIRYDNDKQRAMAHAIKATISSVVGSSITTIAGFLALCFMSYTLGFDLGIVMAKGVVLGVISCITLLPALILTFDKVIEKTRHKPLMPKMKKLSEFIIKRAGIFVIIFAIVAVPAYVCYQKTNDEVYYQLSESLPDDMDCVIANTKLSEKFQVGATHMVLADAGLSQKETKSMLKDIENTKGVKYALSLESVVGTMVPEEMIPDSIMEIFKSDNYRLILINSEYATASDEVNKQCDELAKVIKQYDKNAMLIGEGPCTKDLIEITDKDFKVVNAISLIAIFVIILCVTRSISLPIILVAVIEVAIFINLGLSSLMGTELPFIAPICISTIQLGATVDYAILMTTRYKRERSRGQDKKQSIYIALTTSIPSIVVSALGFFAATFGVAVYSNVDMISSLCILMARGALISMACVILILPAIFVFLDKIICKTTIGMLPKKTNQESV